MTDRERIWEMLARARVPETIKPQSFGPWTIKRVQVTDLSGLQRALFLNSIGFPSYTLLYHTSLKTMHISDEGEVVMEDSAKELRRHLPIWMTASGRILVTGLGLGCVVRGLLANQRVEHVTAVEIDRRILDLVGPEFEPDPRMRLIHGDALQVEFGSEKFNYAWHDLWTDGDRSLQVLHAQLMAKFKRNAVRQGAWGLPRLMRRLVPRDILVR
jgi:hypothetical protein